MTSPHTTIQTEAEDAEAKGYLDRAAHAALRATGHAEPNPLVGAVIVKNGAVIGIGHHRRFGDLHAEREALRNCIASGNDPRGATCYVTLEPCCHHGKQPPCTEALIGAGVARVIYAAPDPAPVSGGGAKVLREAGIGCDPSDASPLARSLSEPFRYRLATGLPWVIAKWAQTIDGRIATRTGESKWISGPRSRARVHKLRSRVDVILTAMGTVRADDPLLTARCPRPPRRIARRVVIDPELELPLDSQLVRTARDIPTAVACAKSLAVSGIMESRVEKLEAAGVDIVGVPESTTHPGRLRLDMLLRAVAERFDAMNVMIEAGAGLLGALFEEDLVCEAHVYVAPLLLADEFATAAAVGRVTERLADGRRYRLCRARPIDDDVELIYRRNENRLRGQRAALAE